MDVFEFRGRGNSGVDDQTERLATAVIGAIIEVHKELGPGMPERAYLLGLSRELTLRQIPHACEVPLPITYKGVEVGSTRMDILVDGRLVLELKSVESLAKVHQAQLAAYLKLSKLQFGLLINFNVERVASHIQRVVNTR